MFRLIKRSGDGWEKAFNTEQETVEELSKLVCPFCEAEASGNLYELLATYCGAEFMLEEGETLEELVKEFFEKYLNRVEETESGGFFNPIVVTCCRSMMIKPLGELLEKMRAMVDASPNPLNGDNNDNNSNLWP